MRRPTRRILAIAVTLALAAFAEPALAQRDTVLTIGGDVDHPYALTAAEFSKLPHTGLRAVGHDALSDPRDGQPTTAAEGPLRVVATGDKRFARWVRQVTSITIRRL